MSDLNNNRFFNEEPLSKTIKSRTGISTFLENDSRAMAFGEFACGAVQEEKDVLFITLDYGTGMGIMINGKLFYGKSGFSGELGHIPFFENEIICHCGKKGCLETEVSGSALIRNFRDRIKEGSTSIVLFNKKYFALIGPVEIRLKMSSIQNFC